MGTVGGVGQLDVLTKQRGPDDGLSCWIKPTWTNLQPFWYLGF